MSEKRARFVGHPDGADITVTFDNGEIRSLHVAHGGELPSEVGGLKVPASYRDSLLEQKDNWTEVKRATGEETKGKTDTAEAEKKGVDR